MTASKLFAASLITLSTLGASAAFAGDDMPFAGERPFGNETPSYSFRSRAAVQAEGETAAGQIAAGENNRAASAASTDGLSRTEVRAEGQTAMANDQIATGEQSLANQAGVPSGLSRAEVRADARQAMRNGQMPAAGEFN